MNKHKTNICLNMIVKNETKVLPRLFKSVHKYIDYYVIVDTGSTDGTPELIQSEMKKYGIEGEVHHRDWVNFGHNRQQALEFAVAAKKADWLLFIDADEEFDVSDTHFYENLKPGISYNLEKHHGDIRYAVPHLIDISKTQWKWKGVVHNYLQSISRGGIRETRKDAWIIYHSGEGAKSQGMTSEQKYLKDVGLLENELKKRPDDARSQFYVAQSYLSASYSSNDPTHQQKAYSNYIKRSKMTNGWSDEVYVSLLEAGILAHFLGKPHEEAIALLLSAHELRPGRAEALYRLAKISRLNQKYHQAYVFAKASGYISAPHDGLFINHMVYTWLILDELSVAASRTGRHKEAIDVCDEILQKSNDGLKLNDEDIKRIKANREFSVLELKKKFNGPKLNKLNKNDIMYLSKEN